MLGFGGDDSPRAPRRRCGNAPAVQAALPGHAGRGGRRQREARRAGSELLTGPRPSGFAPNMWTGERDSGRDDMRAASGKFRVGAAGLALLGVAGLAVSLDPVPATAASTAKVGVGIPKSAFTTHIGIWPPRSRSPTSPPSSPHCSPVPRLARRRTPTTSTPRAAWAAASSWSHPRTQGTAAQSMHSCSSRTCPRTSPWWAASRSPPHQRVRYSPRTRRCPTSP